MIILLSNDAARSMRMTVPVYFQALLSTSTCCIASDDCKVNKAANSPPTRRLLCLTSNNDTIVIAVIDDPRSGRWGGDASASHPRGRSAKDIRSGLGQIFYRSAGRRILNRRVALSIAFAVVGHNEAFISLGSIVGYEGSWLWPGHSRKGWSCPRSDLTEEGRFLFVVLLLLDLLFWNDLFRLRVVGVGVDGFLLAFALVAGAKAGDLLADASGRGFVGGSTDRGGRGRSVVVGPGAEGAVRAIDDLAELGDALGDGLLCRLRNVCLLACVKCQSCHQRATSLMHQDKP